MEKQRKTPAASDPLPLLRRKLALAEERIVELEHQLGVDETFAPCLGLTRTHQKILGLMMRRNVVSLESIRSIIYDMSTYGKEEPSDGCVRTFIFQMRKRLAKFDVRIETVWGTGYRIAQDHKHRIRTLSGQIQT